MKWYQQLIFIVYSFGGIYLIYLTAIHFFVYFGNQSLGHNPSLKTPSTYLIASLITASYLYFIWYSLSHAQMTKLGNLLLYLPLILVLLVALYTIVILLSSGGRWN